MSVVEKAKEMVEDVVGKVKAAELKDKAVDAFGTAMEKAHDVYEKVKDKAHDAFGDAKETADDAVGDAKETAEDAVADAKESAERRRRGRQGDRRRRNHLQSFRFRRTRPSPARGSPGRRRRAVGRTSGSRPALPTAGR